uniref:ADAM metallopeptidase domain 32 n=1 Tax=Varanus komodoensis TaxID=61221 RepID=A0A8D2LKB2_VARKO
MLLYFVHRTFLPNDFMVYTYNQGGFVHPNSPRIQGECFYQGYIEGFPNSVAILNTCSGLRGLLQFENISYGIEHLESSSTYEHLIYQITSKNLEGPLWTEDFSPMNREERRGNVSYKLLSDTVVRPKKLKWECIPFQYNYMGSNRNEVTQSIAQLIGFVNSKFSDLNLTVVLSSLEFWTDHNKISTEGEPDELLRRFLQWKNSYLVLRPHDLAFLLVSITERKNRFSGSTCAVFFQYQKAITMETFSVILAQLLGLALGMEYDDGKNCACPGPVCVMNTAAVHSSGVKAFSSCSIEDFQNFIKFKTPNCLSNRPNLKLYYKKKTAKGSSFCGNGVVEPGEKCDCGSAEDCRYNKCCTRSWGTRVSPQEDGHRPLLCALAQFKPRNVVCRPAVDGACDLPEYCNGSAASCPADVHVQNGFQCASNTGFCYGGSCQSPDLHCQDLFGKSKQARCFLDRFGHCGTDGRSGFKTCSLRNIRCGKLICTYPYTTPFTKMKVPVLYTPVKGTVCISLDLKQPEGASDPMLVKEGTKCGHPGSRCRQCQCDASAALLPASPSQLCNSKKNCHCHPGWAPPNCKERGSPLGGSVDSGVRILESGAQNRAPLLPCGSSTRPRHLHGQAHGL